MKKWLLFGGGGIVVVIAGVIYFVISNLDSIVKEAVERIGTEVTKAKVTLDEVEISTTSGKGALRGLTVGNPAGFHTDNVFELGEVSITVDTSSIGSDIIVIKEILIAGPKVTYELGSDGSNVDAIKKNVEAFTGGSSGGGSSSGAGDDGGEGPKLIIENLYIKGGEVNVSATFLKGKKLGSPLPDIHLKDIGKEEGAAEPAEVAKQLIDAITKGAGDAVSGLGLDKMMEGIGKAASGAVDAAKDAAAGATGMVKDAVSGATGTTGSAVDAAKEGAAKATGTLKKLLGN